MKINKTKLLFIATLFFLAIPLILMGNAQAAVYDGDGAIHNGTTGLWEVPADTATCFGNTADEAEGTAPHSIDISTIASGSKCNSVQPAWFVTTYPDTTACTGAGLSWSSSRGCRNSYVDNPDPAYAAARTAHECLYCHSGGHASNRSGYLKGGHKNMSRMADGLPWAGSIENGSAIYSGYNWNNPGTTAAGTPYFATTTTGTPVFWIYDGWIGTAPRAASPSGSYACGRCHTTGWTADATPQTTKEPIASFGNSIATDVNLSAADDNGTVQPTSSWDHFGILCSRCHNAADGGHANSGPGQNMEFAGTTVSVAEAGASQVAICYNCHRAVSSDNLPLDAATRNIGTELKVANSHGSVGLTSHDNGYLNSPHAKFSGTYGQLSDPNNYSSHFVTADGTCAGCHNPHDSVTNIADNAEPFENECGLTCHASGAYAKTLTGIKHPAGFGTPLENATDSNPQEACATCHMPGGLHLFRISTDENYVTFPTVGANAATIPSSTGYPEAYVDLDHACGQCHGGGTSSATNPAKAGIPYMDRQQLSAYAEGMHGANAAAPTVGTVAGVEITDYTVTFSDASSSGTSISVNWGDGTVSNGSKGDEFSHTYTQAATYYIMHTASANNKFATETLKAVVPSAQTSGGTVTVQVDDYAAAGLADVSLYLKKNGLTKMLGSTASDGSFTFTEVPTGTYDLLAYQYGVMLSSDCGGVVTVDAGTPNATCTFSQTQTQFTLNVSTDVSLGSNVFDVDGNLTDQGGIITVKYNGVTKGIQRTVAGAATFNGLTSGTYSVSAMKNGFTCTSQDVPVSANTDVTISCVAN